MQCSLSTLVDNLSGNDKKESCNKFTDSMRFMTDSLSQSINKISQASLIEKFFLTHISYAIKIIINLLYY